MREVSRNNKKRVVVVFMILAALMFILLLRVAWLQIVRADELTELAVEQQTKDVPIEAKRGDILDCNGNKLATSATCYNVWIRPSDLRKSMVEKSDAEKREIYEKAAADIAAAIHKDKSEVLKKLNKEESIVKLARYIEKEDAKKLKKLGTPGLILSESSKRYYPMGNYASQALGSVTDDNAGRSGLELQYDQYLSGIAGRWIKNTDINGDELSFGKEAYYQAEDGCNLVLTIDQVIQYYVETALKKGMKNTQAERIMCIAMSPKTGDILAMAVTPGFDPNDATQPATKKERKAFEKLSEKKQVEYLYSMWRNPLVNDTYEPGSTFKLLTAASALEEGATTTKEKFNCDGKIRVANAVTLHCANGVHHGSQLLKDAVGNSCNVVHVQLALRLGITKFYDYLALFGITDKTGIDYPGEAFALIQSQQNIGPVELATMGYGQGIAVTPIQLITAISSIGNKGVVMQPRLVKELTDKDGKTVRTFGTKAIRRVLSEETAEEMCKIMEYEVSVGGGGTAKIPGYRVGGKTGTANKASISGYSNDVFSSFTCMAPMDDPQIALLVICDNPKGVKFGSYTAAPIAKDILDDTLRYMGVEPKYSSSEAKELNKKYTKVPKVTGKTPEEAVGVVGGSNLKSKVIGKKNKVVDQYPKAGQKIQVGGTVYIYAE